MFAFAAVIWITTFVVQVVLYPTFETIKLFHKRWVVLLATLANVAFGLFVAFIVMTWLEGFWYLDIRIVFTDPDIKIGPGGGRIIDQDVIPRKRP